MQECEMKCTIFNGTLVWETNTRNGVRISLLKQIRITSVVLTWDRRSSILLVPFSVVFLVVFLIDFLFVVLQLDLTSWCLALASLVMSGILLVTYFSQWFSNLDSLMVPLARSRFSTGSLCCAMRNGHKLGRETCRKSILEADEYICLPRNVVSRWIAHIWGASTRDAERRGGSSVCFPRFSPRRMIRVFSQPVLNMSVRMNICWTMCTY